MSRVKIGRRVYLNEDRSRAVPEGDPDARFLLCPAGGEVEQTEAARLGLLDQPAARPQQEPQESGDEAEPESKPEPKARAKPADKQRRPSANKAED